MTKLPVFFVFFMILSFSIGFFNPVIMVHSPDIKGLSVEPSSISSLREIGVSNDILTDYAAGRQIQLPFSGFIQNLGQVKDDSILYYYFGNSLSVSFGLSTITFVCSAQEESVSFVLNFPGAQTVAPIGRIKKAHTINYFYNDFQFTNIPTWDEIWYDNLYPGIDLRYYMSSQGLKYDFVVHPGANPTQITVQVSESITLSIDEQNVYLQSRRRPDIYLQDSDLAVFQADGTPVPARFIPKTVRPNSYGFHLAAFDSDQKLIIDPMILSFSTYLSGNNSDVSYGIAFDAAGNVYVAGYTFSTDFPTTLNAYNTTGDGSTNYEDVFVCKLAANGSTLLYSTYVSGNRSDVGKDLVIDTDGNAYVTGYTASTDFPTVNAYNATGDGSSVIWDAFAFKLAANGSKLLYSTYISGSDDDLGQGIEIDDANNTYVTGYTRSTDFPTVNAYDNTHNGDWDVFVCKLAASGSTLLYSTYVGGSSKDYAYNLAIDYVDNVYVTGETLSLNFPTVNAYNATGDGSSVIWDAFAFKLAANGSTLFYSTYISGNDHDRGRDIAVDGARNAYVTGHTASNDFPTVNAFQNTHAGSWDVFVCKLAASGSTLLYSTYLGGSAGDYAYGITIDDVGNAYITGDAHSTDFPMMNAYNATFSGGNRDAFVSKLAADGNKLLFSTYLGGNYDETGTTITVDSVDNVYVTGGTYSTNFPTTPNAYNTTGDGDFNYWDVFVSKFSFPPPPPQVLAATIGADQKVILIWGKPIDDGSTPTTAYRVYRTTVSGVYAVFLAETTSEAFIDSSAVTGVTYYYVVTAVNIAGESIFSNEINIVIPTPDTAPSAPQSLTATPGDNYVYLSWTTPSSDGGSPIMHYRVYRGTSSGTYFFLGVATSTNFNDTTAVGGTTYYYVVTAVNDIGESNFSNEVSTTAAGSPPSPVTTTITSTTTRATTFTSTMTTTVTATTIFTAEIFLIALVAVVLWYRRRRKPEV